MASLADLVEARNKTLYETPASFYKALNALLSEDEQGRAVAEMLVGKNGMPFILNNTSFLASPHAQCIEPRPIFPAFDRLFDLCPGTTKPRYTCVVGGKNGLSDARTCPAHSKKMEGGAGCKHGGWARKDHVLKWLQPALIHKVPALAVFHEKRKLLRHNEKKRRDKHSDGTSSAAAAADAEEEEEEEQEQQDAEAEQVKVVGVVEAPVPPAPAPVLAPLVVPVINAAAAAAASAEDAMDIEPQPAHRYATSHQIVTIDEDNESWDLLPRYLAPGFHTALFSDLHANTAHSGSPLATYAALDANVNNMPIQRLYRLRSLTGYYQPDESIASYHLAPHSTTMIMQREVAPLFLVFHARQPVLLSIKCAAEPWVSKGSTRLRPVRFILTTQSKHPVDRAFYEETGMLRLDGLVALECEAFAGTLMLTSHDLFGTAMELDHDDELEDTSVLVHLTSPGKITVQKARAKLALIPSIPLANAAHSQAKRNERRVLMEKVLLQSGGGSDTKTPAAAKGGEEAASAAEEEVGAKQTRTASALADDGSYAGDMNHFCDIQLFVVNARQLTWSMNDADPQRRRVVFASPDTDKRLIMRRLVHPSGRVELPLLQINDCVVRVKKVRHQGSGDTDFQYEMLKHSPLGTNMAAQEKQFHALYAQQEESQTSTSTADLEAVATTLYGPRVDSFDLLVDFLGVPTARASEKRGASDEVLEQQRSAKRPRLAQSGGKQPSLSAPGKQPRPQHTGGKRPLPREPPKY